MNQEPRTEDAKNQRNKTKEYKIKPKWPDHLNYV
jgi:hypothetical protein